MNIGGTSANERGDGRAYDPARVSVRVEGRVRTSGRTCAYEWTDVSVRTCVDTFTRHVRAHVRK